MKNGIPTYNVIPSGDISPISKLMESYLPNYPNSPNASHLNSVITTQLSGNYGNQGTSGRDNYNWDWRWDYDISAKNHVSTVGAMGTTCMPPTSPTSITTPLTPRAICP